MGATMKTTFSLLILLLLLLSEPISSVGNSSVGCIEIEREALLKFKKGFEDPSNRLSSWVGEDCCNWMGVRCSNHTGNVIKLDLKGPDNLFGLIAGSESTLSGELNPSLLDLKYLNYLDLSNNDFQGRPIPHFVGFLKKLSYLNLSNAFFAGMVPPSLGNLSNLRHLDLSTNMHSDLNWLSGLTSLEYLTLDQVNLSQATNHWLEAVNMLPSLLELRLTFCELHNLPQTLPSVNFSSLMVLHMPYNDFNSSSIPQWLFNITSLTDLNLYSCNLKGPIPKVSPGNLCHLQTLDLSGNSNINGDITEFFHALSRCNNSSLEELDLRFNKLSGNLPYSLGHFQRLKILDVSHNSISGSIPSSIANLSLLETLGISNNMMNGTIPESIGQLTELQTLDLILNSWEGIITETHFLNLTKLEAFSLSSTHNSLSLNVAHDWIPPFNLYYLLISSCQLGPAFPAWLRNMKSLMFLTLTNTAISDRVPDWIGNLSSQISMLDLSHNKLSGELPKSLNLFFSAWVDLGFNHLEGLVPLWSNVSGLSLRNNLLSGPISEKFTQHMSQLYELDLSGNFINGSIPPSINMLKKLAFLDLSNNHLSGNIPNYWTDMQQLGIIDLSKNNLSGGIPSSMCSLPFLHLLQLSNNNLSGDLSLSLQNCMPLNTLDLGENRFSGTIPTWIGERLFSIEELRLRGNMLFGNIPEQLCRLPNINVLDLGHNNLSGSIPTCLGELIRLKHSGIYFKYPQILKLDMNPASDYSKHMDLFVKGRQFEFTDQISIQNIIDLSQNNLSGEIPTTLTDLVGLVTLNLTGNQLTGKIPENIGALQCLETLDLSCNHLSGPIPPSMSSMTFLSHLNLSYNNLSGQIPSANQFLTFDDPSIYEGNPLLCGPPLPAKCSMLNDGGANNKHKEDVDEDDEEGSEKFWFYVSIVLGFIVGFWTVCGSLVIKKSWRDAYFRFIDQMKDRLYVVVAVNMVRLRRKIKGERQ